MPTTRDEAVCIRHWDFSETSQTVSLFTRTQGVLRGLAKGAKRVGGRFSGGIDLLTRGEVVAIVKPGRELATLTDWTLLTAWRAVRNDLAANQAGFYAADLVQRMLALGDPHPRLYEALVSFLESLEVPRSGANPSAAATLAFQTVLLDEVGLRPRLELPAEAAATIGFSPDDGGTCPAGAPGAWKVRRPTIELLQTIEASEFPGAFDRARIAPEESVLRANRLLAAYVRHSLGLQPETMRRLFPDL